MQARLTKDIQKEDGRRQSKNVSVQPQRYQIQQNVGNGTFGEVFKATDSLTNDIVAIKRVFQDKRYKNREHQIIQEVKHPNCVNLIDQYFTQGKNENEIYLNLVTNFMPDTLYTLIKKNNKQKISLSSQLGNSLTLVKLYAYQMFRGLAYLNGVGVCHRDIKPSNVLVDSENHLIQICDFGSAKKLSKTEQNIAYICSRYYRAPELIFGAVFYTNAIDVWSTACVIAETILGEPIFPGRSATEQLLEIIKIIGTPNSNDILSMNPEYKPNSSVKIPVVKPVELKNLLKGKCDQQTIDFLSELFVYNPQKRLSPLQALAHPYFHEIREKKINTKLDLFNFTPGNILTSEELSFQTELSESLRPF